MNRSPSLLAAILVTAAPLPGSAREDISDELAELLAKRKDIPGIVAARISDGKIVAIGAAGVRKAGDKTPVEVDDKFHLGSDTKAMTATLAAILVEQGKIKWETTIGEIIKEDWVVDEFRKATLVQLLSNTGGCPKSPPNALWMKLFVSKAQPMTQRMQLAKGILSVPPEYEPGKGFEYSNAGYAIAGIMLERVADTAWEKLITKELFKPLKMESAGFRAPASGRKKPDQPWGHQKGMPMPPKPYGDNPDAIGPAGTVHCSIEDWAKFALLHLEAKPGALLKKQESFAMMHKPHDKESGYCLGWGARRNNLMHDGSNTMWYASIKLDLGKKVGLLVCVNSGGEEAAELCHDVVEWLEDR